MIYDNPTQPLDCLQEAIYWEARSESLLGQYLVGAVIMNRVSDHRWPDDICGVIYQKAQFSYLYHEDGRTRRQLPMPKDKLSWERARRVATKVLVDYSAEFLMFPRINHYFADYIAPPRWSSDYETVIKVGVHIFLADKKQVKSRSK